MIHKSFYLWLLLIAIHTTVFATETILFIRHAEKPGEGLGQLSCKGFDRSISLPNVILKKFGEPDYLVAPNPTIQKLDKGISYNYLRPLATLEPFAIKISKNINLTCGYDDINCISNLLLENKYENKIILVAWEHHNIEDIVKKIALTKGVTLNIPNWDSDDFDTIYVLKMTKNSLGLTLDKEGLENQNEKCNF